MVPSISRLQMAAAACTLVAVGEAVQREGEAKSESRSRCFTLLLSSEAWMWFVLVLWLMKTFADITMFHRLISSRRTSIWPCGALAESRSRCVLHDSTSTQQVKTENKRAKVNTSCKMKAIFLQFFCNVYLWFAGASIESLDNNPIHLQCETYSCF